MQILKPIFTFGFALLFMSCGGRTEIHSGMNNRQNDFNVKKGLDLDFLEIGTSDFDTELEKATANSVGISVEPIKHYLDKLPNKEKCQKLNYAISNKSGKIKIFYIKEEDIMKYNLPSWVKGASSVNQWHPTTKELVLSLNLDPETLFSYDEVDVITMKQLIERYNIESIKFLKLDTEGHDTIILNDYFELCKINPKSCAKKIQFESNVLSNQNEVDKIIEKFKSVGYDLVFRGHDTILELPDTQGPNN